MRKKGKKIVTIILIIVCFIGLCALLYPTVANFWNENYTTKAVNEYVHVIDEMSEEDYQKYWDQAKAYNHQFYESGNGMYFYKNHREEYTECLNPDNSGIMGYIEIPKLNVYLPIFHTTSPDVLLNAIGHLEWTSLPTGGENTHCAVSGHRGLASAKLFSDVDLLREGDQFSLNIMNEVLTYEVDQIRTVLPNEIDELAIVPGMDYCTLITCTPYGINTHRLLVRGHRIETNSFTEIRIISEAVFIDQVIVATILATPILFALFMMVMLKKPEQKPKAPDERKRTLP